MAMERGGMPIGGRYGIWGVNPYGQTVTRTPGIETATRTAEGVSKLFKSAYENQQEKAKAQLAQGTVGSEITSKNAKNQADQQYYPLQQMFKAQQEQQTVKEIMARTGTSYAQAQHMLAGANAENARAGLYGAQSQNTANPFTPYGNMIKTFQALPDGSQQKIALGAILDRDFAGGMFPGASGSGKSNAMPSIGVSGGRDPRFGSTRGGAGGTYQDANGNRISTDTNANTTQDQKTIAAVQRATPLVNEIAQKQAPFMTLKGKAGLTGARLENLFGGNNASPSNYATAQADSELAAESLIKAYGLNVTDQSANMMKAAIKPLPGESPEFYKARLFNTLQTVAQNQQEAQERLNSGTPVGQGEPSSAGYFAQLAMGKYPAQQQQPQQQYDPVQLDSWAQEAIAKGADPSAVQARMQQMRGGNG